ncbi:alcohol dehydrogenase 1 [Cordyceps fumosorosea ARSEF 2679]|uniref:alcohol dehydrogenase n=1 Tax=Cordyceps fumosorosea (strain ARSEF 2679) TaxID=1081104 RepID=A0A167M6T3_CORFA|nr:alcohol dehydrogenase 1 [Cordyceps fumosorosea ARSEF 2679]OAA54009.1 alcohol dehydrogenase 1 [Cordyceps fumosorosea ARSEF 2679]
MPSESSTDAANMAEIPTEQMAQVVEAIGGPLVYKKIPVPKPGPDEVLVHILYSGVCHTDLHAMLGDWPIPPALPLVGGHEGAGVVVALGDLVTSLSVGDPVGVQWLHSSCLACEHCLAGDEPLCARGPDLSGYTVSGSFQQYCLAKASHAARIPSGCREDMDAVAPVLCAGVTVYKALKESGARPGHWVVVAGAGGGLGALACQYARAMGLRVVGIDTGADKEKMVRGMGAEFVDFAAAGGEEGLVARVKKLTPGGLGAHAALVLAAREEPFRQATQYVRARGVVVCVGLPPDNAQFAAPVFDTVTRMIQIRGSYVGNRLDTAEALEFYSRGLIEVPFKTVGLSELQSVYDLLKAGKVTGRYVLDTSR